MVPKRQLCEGSTGRESKRQFTRFPTFVGNSLNGRTVHEFVAALEPFLQNLVREEVERAILRFPHLSPRPSSNHTEPSGTRAWQLHFDGKIPSTLFTGSRIESEDRESIKIFILDASSKKIISSGPLSSLRIEIVVLNGDFLTDDQEDWTEEDFNAATVRQREGKRPLLTGERKLTLRDGVGYIGEVSFTDNSSWIRSRKFRLGARVLQTTPELIIREGRSEAFVVKDHRGELYKKHHPPYLGDEIWRLEKIGKDGVFHKRLAGNGIYTVKDFLRLYVTDPFALRRVFGKITNKTWVVITEHAGDCILDDDELYICYRDTERVGLVFNSIYRVVGVTFDGHTFQSLDKLSSFQMQLVEGLKQHAYKNLNELVPVDEQSTFGFSRTSLGLQSDSIGISSLDLQQGNFPAELRDESEMQLSFNHIDSSPANTFVAEDSAQFEFSVVQNFHQSLRNSFLAKNSCSGPFGGGSCWPTSSGNLPFDDTCKAETSNWLPVTTTWGHGNGFLLDPSSETEVGIFSSFPNFGVHIPPNRKSKARWCKLRAVVKWGMFVRRNAANKRMAKYLNF